MNKKFHFLTYRTLWGILVLTLFWGLNACKDDDDDMPVVELSTQTLDFTNANSRKSFQIVANCPWEVVSSASWLTVEPKKGQNDALITVMAAQNDTAQREAMITVTGGELPKTIQVKQAGNTLSPLPVITIDHFSDTTATGITIHGAWTNTGPLTITEIGVVYKDETMTSYLTQTAGDTLHGLYQATLSNLTANTAYTLKAYMKDAAANLYYSEEKTYTTQEAASYDIQVHTLDSADITMTGATLRGSWTSSQEVTITEKGFSYRENGTATWNHTAAAGTNHEFSLALIELKPATTYSYKAYVKAGAEKYEGTEKTFTTLSETTSEEPTVLTTDASGITATSATVGGSWTCEDPTATVSEKGILYKIATEAEYTPQSISSEEKAFSIELTGLTPATLYKFKAYVKIGENTYTGAEKEFTTGKVSAYLLEEDFGQNKVVNTTPIANFNGWDQKGTGAEQVIYSGTEVDIRNSSPAADCSINNLFFKGDNSTFTINNIQTNGAEHFTLTFEGLAATYQFSSTQFHLALSTDGTTWRPLYYTRANAKTNWARITAPFNVPAGTTTIHLQFITDNVTFKPGTKNTYRIDNLLLSAQTDPVTEYSVATPQVTVEDPVTIGQTSATISARWTSDDPLFTPTNWGIAYKNGGEYKDFEVSFDKDVLSNRTYTATVSALEPNTSYTYKSYILVGGQRIESAEKTFTTTVGLTFGTPAFSGKLIQGEAISNTTKITIPYTHASGEQVEVNATVGGAAKQGISVVPVSKTLSDADGEIELYLSGTPNQAGEVSFTITGITLAQPTVTATVELPVLSYGVPTFTGTLKTNTPVSESKITIPYENARGTETVTVTTSVEGAGADGISVTTLSNQTLAAGNHTLELTVTGTPTTVGEVNFKISVSGYPTPLTATAQVIDGSTAGTVVYGNPYVSGTLKMNQAAQQVQLVIPYSGAQGSEQVSVSATVAGTTGLSVASLTDQILTPGDNQQLVLEVTGTPASAGTVTFTISGISLSTNTVTAEIAESLTFGTPAFSGKLKAGTVISAASITIPYANAEGTESMAAVTVTSTDHAITLESISPETLNAGSGMLTLHLSGTPTEAGKVTFTLNGIGGLTTNTVTATVEANVTPVYTSNVSLPTATSGTAMKADVKIDGKSYNGAKLGSSSKAGNYTTKPLPATGNVTLSFYAVGWSGKSGKLKVTVLNGGTIDGEVSKTFDLQGNDGATGNPPFTMTLGDTDFYSASLEGVTEATTLKFESLKATGLDSRAVYFGVNVK